MFIRNQKPIRFREHECRDTRRRSRGMRRVLAASACISALVGSNRLAPAQTTAKAGSGGWAARSATNSGSETWRFSTPTARDVMNWSSGVNVTDLARHRINRWTEAKFAFPGPTGRRLTGFTDIDGPGPLGSRAGSRGLGVSGSWSARTWGTNYTVKWSTVASGTLGPGRRANYYAVATANDPFHITPDGLAATGVSEPEYDLFLAAGLDAGCELGAVGEITLEVYYDVADRTTNLLNIVIDNDGVRVVGEEAAGLSFYALDELEEGPTEIAANRITLAEIESILTSDLAPDGVLDTPLYLGIIWEDIPVPTVAFPGAEHVAVLRIESDANDAGASEGCQSHAIPWADDFDAYPSGAGLIGHCGWQAWDNNPAFDAIVAPAPVLSPPNSVDVQRDANVVREFEGADNGLWLFQTWQLIPSNFTSGGNGPDDGSYLVLMNTYNVGGPAEPSVVLRADSNSGMLEVFYGNGNQTVNVPYVVDQWTPIEVIFDADNDMAQVFYDRQLVAEYSWTNGAFGQGNGQPNVAAVHLFAGGSSSIFHDDMLLVPLPSPFHSGDLNCDGSFNGGDIDPFFLALGDPAGYGNAFPGCDPLLGDMNQDGLLNGGDIDPFFQCLAGNCP